MSGVVEFLEAELARIEGLARVATPGPWQADADEEEIQSSAGTVARMRDFVRRMSSVQVEADMQLIVGMADPAAVLRRVAADRQILADCQAVLDGWTYGETKELAGSVVEGLARAYGWTEDGS